MKTWLRIKTLVIGIFSGAGFATILFGFVLACTTVQGTDKRVLMLISPEQESQMGAQAFSEMLKTEKVANNPRVKEILQRVGSRISQVAEARHQVGYRWEFKLIESKDANAFCLPGGKVAFYTGILPALENEAAMAMVMGHEVAHATLRHGGQRVSQGLATQAGLAVTSLASGALFKDPKNRDMFMAALGMGATVGIILPFSRSNETEADAWGLEYAAQAGYDPQEAVAFWQRFGKSGNSNFLEKYMSTHPAGDKRVRDLQALQAKVAPLYARSPAYGLGDKL